MIIIIYLVIVIAILFRITVLHNNKIRAKLNEHNKKKNIGKVKKKKKKVLFNIYNKEKTKISNITINNDCVNNTYNNVYNIENINTTNEQLFTCKNGVFNKLLLYLMNISSSNCNKILNRSNMSVCARAVTYTYIYCNLIMIIIINFLFSFPFFEFFLLFKYNY